MDGNDVELVSSLPVLQHDMSAISRVAMHRLDHSGCATSIAVSMIAHVAAQAYERARCGMNRRSRSSRGVRRSSLT